MFKRIISLLLVISIAFAMVSCGVFKKKTKFTIPEGYTLLKISWELEENGLCTSEEFIKIAQTYDEWVDLKKYPFLEGLKSRENICFYLEGYIFPLTYEIPEGATAKEILLLFLDGTKKTFNDEFMTKVEKSGYSLHEILTLSSIIEKEAKLDEQRYMISSVLHNRLDVGMKLECDPTVKYCTGVIEQAYPDKIDHFKYYYNTYRCDGLMAGPICNPGIKSIDAALNPAESDYLYFIIGMVEPYVEKYSMTLEEHEKYHEENYKLIYGKEKEENQ